MEWWTIRVYKNVLMVTSLLKDSIQDSLNMIVSDDGKLSDAAVRRQLDTEFPSVMRKPIPFDAVFKDQAKSDTQNSVISLLLTQIEIGKKQKEKEIKKQKATAPSMKDLAIAERLQQLSQCNRNRLLDGSGGSDDDDDDGNGRPPPPTQQQLSPPPYDFPHSFSFCHHLIMTMIMIMTLLFLWHLLKN